MTSNDLRWPHVTFAFIIWPHLTSRVKIENFQILALWNWPSKIFWRLMKTTDSRQTKIGQGMFDGRNFTMLRQREQKLFWLWETVTKFDIGRRYWASEMLHLQNTPNRDLFFDSMNFSMILQSFTFKDALKEVWRIFSSKKWPEMLFLEMFLLFFVKSQWPLRTLTRVFKNENILET